MVKTGRPTQDPKPFRIVVRINEKQLKILEKYCKDNNCNKMQAIRKAIEFLG